MYNCLEERLENFKTIDQENYSFENLQNFCQQKINNLLLDFFLREKFLDTAQNYINEEKIKGSIEYSIFQEIQKITKKFKEKDITDALSWCNTNKNKLAKLNIDIKFKLLRQQFLEIYKRDENIQAVIFARENFVALPNIKEIQELMVILAVKKEYIDKLPQIQVIKKNFFQIFI